MAHFIIDVHNLLYARGRRPSAKNNDFELDALIKKVVYFSDYEAHQITLVFDGTQKSFTPFLSENIECLFSGPEGSADLVIEKLLSKLKIQQNILVITDDFELRNAALSRGFQYLSTEWFLKTISAYHP